MKTIRSMVPLAARSRNSAGPMRDRRAARGGTRNDQLSFLDEFEADQAFESLAIEVLPPDIDPNAPDVCACDIGCTICEKYDVAPAGFWCRGCDSLSCLDCNFDPFED